MREQETHDGIAGLVEEARDGAPGAMDRLLAAVRPRVVRWALVRTGSPDEAEDVAQEVAVRVHRRLDSFDGRSRFSSWLYALTRNAALDLHRRRRRRRELTDEVERDAGGFSEVPARSPEALDDARLTELVLACFRELPERQREVFDLSELQGMSSTEIAELLGIEPVSVRANLFKARRSIRRRILESHGELVEDRWS